MARLTILTPQEIDTLYAIPSLDNEERSFLFSLDETDRAILDSLENNTARKVDYILQLVRTTEELYDVGEYIYDVFCGSIKQADIIASSYKKLELVELVLCNDLIETNNYIKI